MAISGLTLSGIGAALAKVAGAVVAGAKAAGGAIAAGAAKVGTATIAGAKAAGGAIATGATKAGGAITTGAKTIGSGIATGATKTGGALSTGAKAIGGGVKTAIGKTGSLLHIGGNGATSGVPMGGAANIEAGNLAEVIGTQNASGAVVSSAGTSAPLPGGANVTNVTAANTAANGAPLPTNTIGSTPIANAKTELLPKIATTEKANLLPKMATNATNATNVKPSLLSKVGSGIKTGAGKTGQFIKNNAGKISGQVLVQGGLSLISAGMAAKTGAEANKVSQQSLLFQQQTYKEQQTKQDEKEARLKSDAWSAYQSANAFGDKLYNTGTNSLLFTSDYKSNPTGNYSLLSGNSASFADSNISLTKYTDLT